MVSKSTSNQTKKTNLYRNKNTIETLKDMGGNVVKKTADEFKKIGSGMFDQFFGNYGGDYDSSYEKGWTQEAGKPQKLPRKEYSLFNYQQYYEKEIVRREIKELTEQIRKEIQLIKKADRALIQEVKDIEKLSLESLPDKPGIYHIRFLEIVLSILRSLRAKIGESRTWLQAMVSKRKKRGSLFAVRSKKQGTLYSLSQELQSARSVQ